MKLSLKNFIEKGYGKRNLAGPSNVTLFKIGYFFHTLIGTAADSTLSGEWLVDH